MLSNSDDESVTLDEIAPKLTIEFPHTIGCKIDELNRQVIVERMELSLEGQLSIPAGWRGKICMVSGIDRKYALYDGIVLPVIAPGRKTPIGPYLAEKIPNDLVNSEDEWQLEFSIVDWHGNEKILLKSPITRRQPSNSELEIIKLKEFYETQLAEKEKAYLKKQNDLNQTIRDLSRQRTEFNNLQSVLETVEAELVQKEEEFRNKLETKEIDLKKSSEQIINSATEISKLQVKVEALQGERDQLKNERDRSKQLTEEQKSKIGFLQVELKNKTDQLAKHQEDSGQLESERDRAKRRVEDLKSKIEGLQVELEASQTVNHQRNQALDEETTKSRRLEEKLKKFEGIQVSQEKTIEQLNDNLNVYKIQLAEKENTLDELREELNQTIVGRDEVERGTKRRIDAYANQVESLKKDLEQKSSELTSRNDELADRNVKLNDMTNQLVKLREDVGQLESERDRAKRRVEDLESKIEGLQAELEASQTVNHQRNQALDEETTKSRRLEREIKRIRETQARHEKTIEQYEKTINRLNIELDRAETEASELRTKRNSLENELSNYKAQEVNLYRVLTEAQSRSEDFRSKLELATSKIAEIQLKFDNASAGKTMHERYDLIKRIRASDTGEVYKVYDKNLDRAVMLKILPPVMASDRRAMRELTKEAELLAKLSHINTIRLYDFVRSDEPYIVMEYVEGRTLRQVIDTDAPLPVDHVLDYIEQICKGLSYSHNQGIYHLNLNPEHLMLADDGFVKIMDFGIAATIHTTMARMTGTLPAEMIPYLSPEQIQGKPNIDGRSDIYSLGIVFYEMLSGQPPFVGEHVNDQHINESPQPIDQMLPEINYILQKCLGKKADDRYAHIDELRKALLDVKLVTNFNN